MILLIEIICIFCEVETSASWKCLVLIKVHNLQICFIFWVLDSVLEIFKKLFMSFLSPVNFRINTTVAVYKIQIEILQFVKMMATPLYASPPAPWQEFKPGICRHIINIMSNTTLAFWPVPSAANTPPHLYIIHSPPPPPSTSGASFIPAITFLSDVLFDCQFLLFEKETHPFVSLSEIIFPPDRIRIYDSCTSINASFGSLWFSHE